mgnify:FL=1
MFGNCGGLDTGDLKYSLQFTRASSEYMSKALTTPTSQRIFTISVWIQRSSTGTYQVILNDGYTINAGSLYFLNTDQLIFSVQDSSDVHSFNTTATYTSTSEEMHIVAVCDTTSSTNTITGTSTDRLRLYVNGNQITSMTASVPPQNFYPKMNASGTTHMLGRLGDGTINYYLDAKLSRFVFIDGQALGPSSFGRYNASGQWISKTVSEISALASGTGANNVMLEFNDNSSASALGNDNSTKNNDYTVFSLSTSDRSINY